MAASPPLVPASRARRRVKGKWSGAEAKFQFLSSHMCDAGLEARVEQLKAASHWWPWLTCNRDQHSDGGVTYTCPTYVLYDALSVDGRGDLERLYQRPTALKVFSEMLRSHLDVPWLSKYMTLPGGGRESRKVMMLKIKVAANGSLAEGIRSRLRSQTVRHTEAPVLLRRANSEAVPCRNSTALDGSGPRGHKRARRHRTEASSEDADVSPSQSHSPEPEPAAVPRQRISRGLKSEPEPTTSGPSASIHGASDGVGEQDAAAALLGLCVGETSCGGSSTDGGSDCDAATKQELQADAETFELAPPSADSGGARRSRSTHPNGRSARTHVTGKVAAAPVPVTVRSTRPENGHESPGGVSPCSPPASWPVKRSRHAWDMARAGSGALPALNSIALPPGIQIVGAACTTGDEALLPLALWQQQQLALGRMHARLASAAQLLHSQLAVSGIPSVQAEAQHVLQPPPECAQQPHRRHRRERAPRPTTTATSGSSGGCPSLDAHMMAPEDATVGHGRGDSSDKELKDEAAHGSMRCMHASAPTREMLTRLLVAVRTWELSPGTPCCQVLVPEGADAVDVPHVCIGSSLPSGVGLATKAMRTVSWQPCAADGCRYVVSVGPLCAEHLRTQCNLSVCPHTNTADNEPMAPTDAGKSGVALAAVASDGGQATHTSSSSGSKRCTGDNGAASVCTDSNGTRSLVHVAGHAILPVTSSFADNGNYKKPRQHPHNNTYSQPVNLLQLIGGARNAAVACNAELRGDVMWSTKDICVGDTVILAVTGIEASSQRLSGTPPALRQTDQTASDSATVGAAAGGRGAKLVAAPHLAEAGDALLTCNGAWQLDFTCTDRLDLKQMGFV
mmetsp:Transcript_45030/g.134385  ORF Transcript_45030/g.134385 Transcript_45030/m.134385 type:complete len:850 (-) Transcript_45030:744-3293(-)